MSTLIKICGITSVEDAVASVEAGADYLGLIFVPSSARNISLEAARAIAKAIGKETTLVGVFQDASLSFIDRHVEELELDLLQLHGNESPEFCFKMPQPVIKVITARGFPSTESVEKYLPYSGHNIHSLLLDFPKTSNSHNWTNYSMGTDSKLKHARHFLAGKITAESAAEIVTQFQPYGIDVASGVESRPGIKDPNKLKDFCRAIRDADKNIPASVVIQHNPTYSKNSICTP